MFRRARETAETVADRGSAVWGLVLTSVYGYAGNLHEPIEDLRELRDDSAVDLVHFANGRMAQLRLSGERISEPPEIAEALHVARELSDPVARTSFTNAYAYLKAIQGLYGEALSLALETLNDAQAYQLSYVAPHAYWQVGLASLGLRRFADCDRALQQAKRAAPAADGFHALNNRCLRARLNLAQEELNAARDEMDYEVTGFVQPQMRAEFQATKALVLAVCSSHQEARAAISSLDTTTSDIHGLVAMAHAVIAVHAEDYERVLETVQTCASLNIWDPFVCAIRAVPEILGAAAREPSFRGDLERVLTDSRDFSLARRFGLRVERARTAHVGLLSPREREVFELLKNGLTNREIARALFISEATAKVHVRHVMEKLGARTRTQAATRVLHD
jgi:DNA-binding NarL/FixJ family response regulator